MLRHEMLLASGGTIQLELKGMATRTAKTVRPIKVADIPPSMKQTLEPFIYALQVIVPTIESFVSTKNAREKSTDEECV
ncbi:MAG: hypothetical protein H0W74_10275 [Sphingosinicella sp.]|nr:hypothetical protein [Sphingosinicella sp.]